MTSWNGNIFRVTDPFWWDPPVLNVLLIRHFEEKFFRIFNLICDFICQRGVAIWHQPRSDNGTITCKQSPWRFDHPGFLWKKGVNRANKIVFVWRVLSCVYWPSLKRMYSSNTTKEAADGWNHIRLAVYADTAYLDQRRHNCRYDMVWYIK